MTCEGELAGAAGSERAAWQLWPSRPPSHSPCPTRRDDRRTTISHLSHICPAHVPMKTEASLLSQTCWIQQKIVQEKIDSALLFGLQLLLAGKKKKTDASFVKNNNIFITTTTVGTLRQTTTFLTRSDNTVAMTKHREEESLHMWVMQYTFCQLKMSRSTAYLRAAAPPSHVVVCYGDATALLRISFKCHFSLHKSIPRL